ncbi:MAG: DUF2236 domain-containing protein [Chloroflexota bacterium]
MTKTKLTYPISNIATYRNHLNQMAAQIPDPNHGFFGPGSMAWQVNREGVLGLGALRALLMQIAHPMVAQGVADHSNFRGAPIKRVVKTMRMQQIIVFGSCDEAIEALLGMYARHSQVSGKVAGSNYQANDSILQLWVHATLVDSIIRAYDQYLPSLSLKEAERFYKDSLIFADLMGIPKEILPSTLTDFNAWIDEMLAGQEVAVTPTAVEIVQSLLKLPLPIFWPTNYILAAGSLPPSLREAYGLKWSTPIAGSYALGVRILQSVAKRLPKRLRWMPPYWRAMKRCR